MEIQTRIDAFEKFGEILAETLKAQPLLEEFSSDVKDICIRLKDLIQNVKNKNPWFSSENVILALEAISGSLSCINIKCWVESFMDELSKNKKSLTIGVVMAGNIPLVGFFDFFYVLMSGHKFSGKLSAQDNKLLPLLGELLISIEPGFNNMIEFTKEKLSGFDAVIATGSDNTSRYFDYYFGKYPNIIRNSRSSVAILSGREQCEELALLGSDIFSYFGLGCRNVSKFYIPRSFSFDMFFDAIEDFRHVIENHKYKNNYDYYKSIYLLNKEKFYDNGFLILKESQEISSPVSAIYYEYYDDLNAVKHHLKEEKERLQCVVSDPSVIAKGVPFGTTQYPQLWDYADNINTMKFLLKLS